MKKSIHLTDTQYKRILLKIKETVGQEEFQYSCVDSTNIGDKYTRSNCGFCNDEFAEKDTALFPENFPERKSIKYRQEHHQCPFDMRSKNVHFGFGCFYDCCLFQNKRYRRLYDGKGESINTQKIRELVDETIKKTGGNSGRPKRHDRGT